MDFWQTAAAIGLPGIIITAVVGFIVRRIEKRLDKEEAERKTQEEARRSFERYQLAALTATMALCEANALALQIPRAENGDLLYDSFEDLADKAGNGFKKLTYEEGYSVFAGSYAPVKKLGWSDLYTSMGITGITMGMTGEAAVNPQIPSVSLPFTMSHEMSHRMCIAHERDANFAAFLGCVFCDVSMLWNPVEGVAATTGLIPVAVMGVSALVMVVLGLAMRKWKWLGDYALPISLVLGMASAIPITAWLG